MRLADHGAHDDPEGLDESSPVDAISHWQSLAPHQREAWLAGLRKRHPDVAQTVDELAPYIDRQDFLDYAASDLSLCVSDDIELRIRSTTNESKIPSAPISIDGYVIGKRLGEGGHAEVWLGERNDGTLVAIKVMHSHLRETLAERRFIAEKQALSRLKHPHIASLMDSGTTADGRLFLALAYVPGIDVATFVKTQRLDWRQIVGLVLQVLDALAAAHDQGIVHRDIKPSNILVSGSATDCDATLIDFGIAKLLEGGMSPATVTGEAAGTPWYMSPEQVAHGAKHAGVPSDIYSVAVVAYELLTGKLPYDLTQLYTTPVDAIRYSFAARTTTINPQVSPAVDAVVARALRKEPAERFQTAAEFSDALRAALHGTRTELIGSGVGYRIRHVFSAYPRAMRIAVVGLSVLLAATAATAWSIHQSRLAVKRQQHQKYLAALADASQQIAEGNLVPARKTLDGIASEARSNEWRWLRTLADGPGELARANGQISAIRSAGPNVVVGTLQGTVMCFSPEGRVVWEAPKHPRAVLSVAVAHWHPDEVALVGHDNGTLQVINTTTSEERQLAELDGPILSIIPQETSCLVLTPKRLVRVQREGDTTVLYESAAAMTSVALARSGELFLSSEDGVVRGGRLLSEASWQQTWHRAVSESSVRSLAFSDSASTLIALSDAARVHWLEASTGNEQGPPTVFKRGCLHVACDGGPNVAIGFNNGLIARGIVRQTDTALWQLRMLHAAQTKVAWTSTGLASGSWDKRIVLQEYSAGWQDAPPGERLLHATFDGDGQSSILTYPDRIVTTRFSDPHASKTVVPLLTPAECARSWNSEIVVGLRDGHVGFAERAQRHKLQIGVATALLASGDSLLVGTSEGELIRFDRAFSPQCSWHHNQSQVIHLAHLDNDTTTAVIVHRDGGVFMLANTLHPSGTFSEVMLSAQAAHAGTKIAGIGRTPRRLLELNLDSGRTRLIELPGEATSAPAYTSRADQLLVGLADGRIAVITCADMQLASTLPISDRAIIGVHIEPSGELLAVDGRGDHYRVHAWRP
ncbi:MAG TPA: serine/threonine-protein kinase [Phycisphaerales bacterium]|nr:serine/threonine-protein kinase [Phycisphaerales bacterium]